MDEQADLILADATRETAQPADTHQVRTAARDLKATIAHTEPDIAGCTNRRGLVTNNMVPAVRANGRTERGTVETIWRSSADMTAHEDQRSYQRALRS